MSNSFIRGVPVELEVRTQTGLDAFNRPAYSSEWETVGNVLIAPAGSGEILDSLDVEGGRATYQLAIPKGDAHEWEHCLVRFFGQTWRVIGKPTEGIESLIPLDWNRIVEVESLV